MSKLDIRYTLCRTWRRLLYRVKVPWFFWQRGRRGWSDDDLWNLDSHLFRILATSLPVLAKKVVGNPCMFPKEAPAKCRMCGCWDLWQKELVNGAILFQKLVEEPFTTNEEEAQTQEDAINWVKKWVFHLWI